MVGAALNSSFSAPTAPVRCTKWDANGMRGASFSANFQLNPGESDNANSGSQIAYGDYQGLAYQSGYFLAVWADNSNSTGTNPDGTHKDYDIYTCRVGY